MLVVHAGHTAYASQPLGCFEVESSCCILAGQTVSMFQLQAGANWATAERVVRCPMLLILDGLLQQLPWESSPSLGHLRSAASNISSSATWHNSSLVVGSQMPDGANHRQDMGVQCL